MEIDLDELFQIQNEPKGKLALKIREIKNAGARFTTSRNNQYISSIVIWRGKGRDQKERKLNLSIPQGKFLYHLPFPSAEFKSISDILKNSEVEGTHTSEILDIIDVLIDFEVIESK